MKWTQHRYYAQSNSGYKISASRGPDGKSWVYVACAPANSTSPTPVRTEIGELFPATNVYLATFRSEDFPGGKSDAMRAAMRACDDHWQASSLNSK